MCICMQCWKDIDSTSGVADQTNKFWVEKTVVFNATSADTWIQIIGNDNPGQLYIDEITLMQCAP